MTGHTKPLLLVLRTKTFSSEDKDLACFPSSPNPSDTFLWRHNLGENMVVWAAALFNSVS